MFRTFRTGAGALSLSRLPLRVNIAARQDAIRVERVRFMRYRPGPRTIIASILTYVTLYTVFTTVVFSPLDNLDLGEETSQEVDELGGSLFIPFPGTIKQIQPPPYRGTDPEWQEYVKFSKDQALGKRVRDELAAFTQQIIGHHPVLVMKIGKEINLRRYWLDIEFPLIPPPEFERSGIEIADDYIKWTTMPVDSLTVFRIRQAIWPSALTQSIWRFSKVLFWDNPAGTKGAPGMPSKTQNLPDPFDMQGYKQSSEKSGKPEQPPNGKSSPHTTTVSRALGEPPRSDPEMRKRTIEKLETDIRNFEKDKPHGNIFQMQLFKAWWAFKTKFAETWKPALNYPPRGSIIVSGLIELDSPRAWLTVDVTAAWDPKTKQYDPRSMRIQMRRLQMKKQAPLAQ